MALQELLDYGDYLDTDPGSGMDEGNDTESDIRLIEIPTGNACFKKNGRFACQLHGIATTIIMKAHAEDFYIPVKTSFVSAW